MSKSICITPECERPIQARQMCTTHWSQWYRANRKQPAECAWCGETFQTSRPKHQVMCSRACASAKAAHLRPPALPTPAPKLKSAVVMRAIWDNMRSDLRAAYEDRCWDEFIKALKARSLQTPEGCWVWTGQTRTPTKSASPYPVQRWAGKYYSMHRLACEARYQKPLGTQQAEPSPV